MASSLIWILQTWLQLDMPFFQIYVSCSLSGELLPCWLSNQHGYCKRSSKPNIIGWNSIIKFPFPHQLPMILLSCCQSWKPFVSSISRLSKIDQRCASAFRGGFALRGASTRYKSQCWGFSYFMALRAHSDCSTKFPLPRWAERESLSNHCVIFSGPSW